MEILFNVLEFVIKYRRCRVYHLGSGYRLALIVYTDQEDGIRKNDRTQLMNLHARLASFNCVGTIEQISPSDDDHQHLSGLIQMTKPATMSSLKPFHKIVAFG